MMVDETFNKIDSSSVTREGNPRMPQGEAGRIMLSQMNESHYDVTGWALQLWSISPDDKILDIGCGGGMTLKRMSSDIVNGHLTGLDYSKISVEESTRLNAKDVTSGKMDIIEASVEKMPFSDNYFDKIITVESFYFWPNPSENLKEVLRVIKPGGCFHIVADIYGKEGLDTKDVENIARYELFNPTPEEFTALLKAAGFSQIVIFTEDNTSWICVQGTKI